jgi:D-amino-acid dehydrogenase
MGATPENARPSLALSEEGSMAKIAVIGAGITGVTSAYKLLRGGHSVTIVDRHRYPAMETSFANGGQLSASNAEVWNNWPTIIKGMRWMLRKDAPLLFNPSVNTHKYGWMAEFTAKISDYEKNTNETVRLAIAAREPLLAMADEENIEFDYKLKGLIHFYRDKQAFDVAAKSNKLLRAGGLDRFEVSLEEIRQIEPAIRGDFYGGFYTPSDASGDIHLFTRGLADAFGRRGGRFLNSTEITHIDATNDSVRLQLSPGQGANTLEVDAVVVCAGVGSRAIAASLGDRINIYPVKGYSITVHLDDAASQAAAPNACLLDEAAKIVTSRLGDGRFRVAGTAEFNGYNKDIRADRIQPLIDWTESLFPEIATNRIVPWAGLRPMTPTMLPRVGQGSNSRVFYNTGHGHLGWTLSGATAEILAQTIDRAFG